MQQNSRRWLWLILIGALALRLLFVLVIDPSPNFSGGDTSWLLKSGRGLLDGTIPEPPQTGPIYLIYAGFIQLIFSSASIQILRILNALMGTALCGFIYLIAARFFNPRVAFLSALLIAFNPIFIIEAGNVLTESPFLFLLFGTFALYALSIPSDSPSLLAERGQGGEANLIFIGILFGLTTLTRAVTLLLPLILIAHLIYLYRRRAFRFVLGLVIAYTLTLSTWTIYNLVRWNHFVIGAEGIAANVYIGTTPGWCGPECVDNSAGITGQGDNQQKYMQGAFATIMADPVGYVRRRLTNVTEALLQPYNTVYYPGASIKSIAAEWWSGGHSLSGLARVTQTESFWPKLALYLFHYLALLFGLIGMLIGWRKVWPRLPIYGTIAYFVALHMVLTAIPRYLFPIEPLLLMFAASALVSIRALATNQHRTEAERPGRDEAQQPA